MKKFLMGTAVLLAACSEAEVETEVADAVADTEAVVETTAAEVAEVFSEDQDISTLPRGSTLTRTGTPTSRSHTATRATATRSCGSTGTRSRRA